MEHDLAADIEGLSLAYGGRTVLDAISLAVPAGAVVGLVGPNGAGKSTLLRCLLGLALPDAGRARVFGCDAADLSDAVRARIGYVPQQPDLVEWMTVQQHLDYIGSFYPRWDAAVLQQRAAQWDLDPRAMVARLSPGGRQKLALLLALGHDPDLVVLDEPVASLDPLARRAFMRALFEGGRDGERVRTVIVSSHLLADLQRVVTHLAFLRQGRLVLFDEWDALADALRRVEGVDTLPAAAGVLGRPGRPLVDLRRFDTAALPPAARLLPLTLDDLFVELMS